MPDVKDKNDKQTISSGLAVASLTVGVFGVLLSWTGVLGLPVSVVAVVFGIVALANKQNHDVSVAGLVLGVVSFLVSAVMLFVLLAPQDSQSVVPRSLYNVHTYQFRS